MKKALVVGLKRSGIASLKLLISLGYEAYAFDDNLANCDTELIKSIGAIVCLSEIGITMFDIVVVSPGIPLTHWIISQCNSNNVSVIGELELADKYCKGIKVAITGTNGKTTTCSLLHHITSLYSKSWLVGNIGDAVTNYVDVISDGDIAVQEVSSFQLETVDKYKPKIACILNITPDHLDRHKTIENYIYTKFKITTNQDNDDYLVLNADDTCVMANDIETNAQKYYFSKEKKVYGAYIFDNYFYYIDEKIAPISSLKLIGKHNISNALCCIVCAKLLGIPNEIISNGLATFEAVAHRLQTVCTHKNITYINDSKATNIDSTLVAIRSINSPTVLIVGGSDKGYQFDTLINNLSTKIVGLVIIGQTTHLIIDACIRCNYDKYYIATSLSNAVNIGRQLLVGGGNLLLSPSCASFDMFTDYIDRGNKFIDIVNQIQMSEAINGNKEHNES